jgi:acyltransferase-like protein
MNDRNIGIDLLRAVAILTVIANYWVLSYLAVPGSTLWDEVLRRVGGHRFYGVTLFFVLSGFLIARTTRSFQPVAARFLSAPHRPHPAAVPARDRLRCGDAARRRSVIASVPGRLSQPKNSAA